MTIGLLEILYLHEATENILYLKKYRTAVNSLVTCSGYSLALGVGCLKVWSLDQERQQHVETC